MILPIKAGIKAVSGFVPPKRLKNVDLEKIVDTSDDWIVDRVGIKERRIAPKDKPTSWMAVKVAKELLKKADLTAEKIDGIIIATVTPDMFFPNVSNIVASQIKAKNAWTYDMMAACSGFVYALSQGVAFIESGRAKNILVIGAEKMSSITDYSDRNTCVLFGDGAAGVLLTVSKNQHGFHDFILGHQVDGSNALFMKAGGSNTPASIESVARRHHYICQEGRIVFKNAIQTMTKIVEDIMKANQLTISDIDWLVPHQANKRIINNVGQNLSIDSQKVMLNIQNYGNTTASTIPLCLWDYEDKIKKGDKLILVSFGAGFTYGACYVTWN